MKRLFVLAIAAGVFVGCSSESEVESTGDSSYVDSSAGAAPAMDSSALGETLNSVQTDLQAGRYEDVAVKMGTLNQLPKTPEQEQEFKKTFYEVQEVLSIQAQQDAQAAAAYQRFGQMMMGR